MKSMRNEDEEDDDDDDDHVDDVETEEEENVINEQPILFKKSINSINKLLFQTCIE